MNVVDDDDEPLLPLVERIAEGIPVDAKDEQQRAPKESDPEVLKALLDIATIEAAHRSAERSYEDEHPAALDMPRRWAHLTILERIGRGEFGQVFRAYDNTLQIDVALKLSAVVPESVEVSGTLAEARLLARVRHPNVVRVYGADHREGWVGLWMDLVHGSTLEELTRTQGFSAAESIQVGIELCRALAAVHAVGLLHGDIKAHNVIRQDGGRIVLVDFGASRSLATAPRAGDDIIGTPVYMAPEVLNGLPRSAASDIYSLGVLLFHIATADYPVYASSRPAFIEAHRTGARLRLRDRRPELPEGFVQVVERAISVDPQARFATAGAFEAALLTAHSHTEVAPPTPPTGRERRKLTFGFGAAVFLSLGAAAFWGKGGAPVSPTKGGIHEVAGISQTGAYEIEAAFYRASHGGADERLTVDSRLRLGDQLHLSVRASAPTYIYVVDEDDKGAAYLLFPLRYQPEGNLVPPDTLARVPGELNWRVDRAGGKEHLLVFASSEPLTAFEGSFKKLPSPRLGEEPQSEPLPHETLEQFRGVGTLRSVGGLTPATRNASSAIRYRDLFTTALAGRETARGLWVRQLTLTNTGK